MVTCVIDVEVGHTAASPIRLRTRRVTPVKMFESESQPRSGKLDQHNIFCEEKSKVSGQTSSEMEMGM